MKVFHSIIAFICLLVSSALITNQAKAGVINSTTNANLTQRTCPSVNSDFSAYKAKWGDTILEHYAGYLPGAPTTVEEITPEAACIFNTQWEKWFPDANPGTVVSLENIQNNVNNAFLENEHGDIWLEAVLDNTALALPEAHFVVGSQESERNSANLFSAQSFLWEGDTQTLEFSAFFDFSMSVGTWGMGLDSLYGLRIGASKGLVLSEGSLFPDSWGVELAKGVYESPDDQAIIDESINFRSLSISFEVNDGDEFQLWGMTQAFALNGGWIDSANTMRTQLAVAGLDEEKSKEILSNSLSVKVPEPTSLIIFALGLIGLASRQFVK